MSSTPLNLESNLPPPCPSSIPNSFTPRRCSISPPASHPIAPSPKAKTPTALPSTGRTICCNFRRFGRNICSISDRPTNPFTLPEFPIEWLDFAVGPNSHECNQHPEPRPEPLLPLRRAQLWPPQTEHRPLVAHVDL